MITAPPVSDFHQKFIHVRLIVNEKFLEMWSISSLATLTIKFLSQTDRMKDRHFPEIINSCLDITKIVNP